MSLFNKTLSHSDTETMCDLWVMLARLRLRCENIPVRDHFKIVRTLGSGAFGCVNLCHVGDEKSYARKGDLVVIKRMTNVSDVEMAGREAMVLKRLEHQHLVRYLIKDNLCQLCIVIYGVWELLNSSVSFLSTMKEDQQLVD